LSILWDTSAIIAYYNEDDEFHEQAERFMETIKRGHPYRKLIITDYILDETLTFMECVLRDQELAEAVGDSLMESIIVSRGRIGEDLLQEAWQRFKARRGRSFTDCSSFCFMEKNELKTAFTFDSHFRKEGFETVP